MPLIPGIEPFVCGGEYDMRQPARSMWCVSTCIDIVSAFILNVINHKILTFHTMDKNSTPANGIKVIGGGVNYEIGLKAVTAQVDIQPKSIRNLSTRLQGGGIGGDGIAEHISHIFERYSLRLGGKIEHHPTVGQVKQVTPSTHKPADAFDAIYDKLETGKALAIMDFSVWKRASSSSSSSSSAASMSRFVPNTGHGILACGYEPDENPKARQIIAHNPDPSRTDFQRFKRKDMTYTDSDGKFRKIAQYCLITWT